MAFVYLKIKNREEAEKIVKEVLECYKDQVISYDLEELSGVNLSDPSVMVRMRRVLRKGGSINVNIPKDIASYMDLSPNSLLAFVIRKNIKHVYITKVLALSNGKRAYSLREQKE